MTKFLLRVGALVLFCSFAAVSGAFASTHDDAADSWEGVPLGMTTDKSAYNVYSIACGLVSESTEPSDPLVSNPAELQKCIAACKAGGATILRYCGTMPTPQLRVMCLSASAIGTVSCMGFCYARFVD